MANNNTTYASSATTPSTTVTFPSTTKSAGNSITKSAMNRLRPVSAPLSFIMLPRIASIGMIKSNITKDAPIRFPTDTCGTRSTSAFVATEISPMEVKNPRIKNPTTKPLLLSLRENLSTARMRTPLKYQMTVPAVMNMSICTRRSMRWSELHRKIIHGVQHRQLLVRLM